MRGKKALTPLVATMILVVFSLIVGTLTMNWGKSYVGSLDEGESIEEVITIDVNEIDTPLKEIQIKYINGEITLEEYLEQQKNLQN
jgi:hypothetical protein